MFSRLFISAFIVLLPKHFSQACGFWAEPGTYRFWLLQPDITREPDLSPFYIATSYLYQSESMPAKEVYLELNIKEWLDVTNNAVLGTDIDSAMNYMAPEKVHHNWNDLVSKNTFLRWLDAPANSDYKDYFLLSKQTEEITGNPDPWGEAIFPLPATKDAVASFERLYKNTSSLFLKTRSAYQLIRLQLYSNNYRKLQEVYHNKLLPLHSDSWVMYAGMFQLARTVGNAESNYLLSRCFASGKFQRASCVMHFQTDHLKETLTLAKNNQERSQILTLFAIQEPGQVLTVLQQIDSLDPKNPSMPFLIAREINKLEDWLLTTSQADFLSPATREANWWNAESMDAFLASSRQNRSADQQYAQQLDQFIDHLDQADRYNRSALWLIYRAHLAWVKGKPAQSRELLASISTSKNLPVQQKSQLAIMRYLLNLENGWSPQNENQFMRLLKASEKSLGLHDAKKMKNQLILYTARKLMRQGNNPMGLLLLSKTNRTFGESGTGWDYKDVYEEMSDRANGSDYSEMISIMKKQFKSPFEAFITNKWIRYPEDEYYWYEESYRDSLSVYKLINLQSSWYLRQHQLPAALKVLEQIPDTMWAHWPESDYVGCDPVFLNIYHPHKNDPLEDRNMNKKEVIKEMIRLEALAKKNPKSAAEYYFQLANCWYNLSYHGKNWILTKTWWRYDELDLYPSEPRVKRSMFHDDYFGCKQASIYYTMAMNLARDKNLRAFSYFMVRQCHKNMLNYRMNTSEGKNISATTKKQLQKINPKLNVDTALVGTLIRECETYQSFVKQYCKPLN
jgi:hypothetical protein